MMTNVPRAAAIPPMSAAPYPRSATTIDARAQPTRDLLRAVGAAVVGDDDLAVDPVLANRALRLLDADPERVRLVEAGHDDGDLRNGVDA